VAASETIPPDLEHLVDLSSRVALITGASSGIGAAIARRFAAAGASLVLHYHENRSAVETLLKALEPFQLPFVEPIQADLARPQAVEALFQTLDSKGIGCNVLINNAALQPVKALLEMDLADWQETVATNLDAVFLTTRLAAERMQKLSEPSGSIINIASIEGHDPARGHTHYATSKAGLLMFTRASALEYAPEIRVNSVSPGLIDRPRLELDWPQGVSRWCRQAPLARLGQAMEVAEAVAFLAGNGAHWITGVDLIVDGGMSVQPRW